MAGKVAIALIKKEAELYRSHGLYKESLRLYTQLLGAVSDKHPEIKQSLQASIERIKKEVFYNGTTITKHLFLSREISFC